MPNQAPHTNPHQPHKGNLFRELEAARSAAIAAGEIIRRHYRDRGFTIDQKGKDNPVTTADFEADRALRELLYGGFPDYVRLSEETAHDGALESRECVLTVSALA